MFWWTRLTWWLGDSIFPTVMLMVAQLQKIFFFLKRDSKPYSLNLLQHANLLPTLVNYCRNDLSGYHENLIGETRSWWSITFKQCYNHSIIYLAYIDNFFYLRYFSFNHSYRLFPKSRSLHAVSVFLPTFQRLCNFWLHISKCPRMYNTSSWIYQPFYVM